MHRDGPRPSKVQGHGSSVCPNLFIFPRKTEPWRQRWKDERWGGGGRRKRVALAPRARWISIMLNRKWSPAIECLSAPPLEAHKAGWIRLLRCNVTEKLNSLVLSATAFARPIVRFLPFPPPLSPLFCSLLPPPHLSGTPRAKTTAPVSLFLSNAFLSFPFFSLRQNKNKLEQRWLARDGYSKFVQSLFRNLSTDDHEICSGLFSRLESFWEIKESICNITYNKKERNF